MKNKAPNWVRLSLLCAAVYNLVWGIWVICFPEGLFQLLQIERPNYPAIWQAIGMIVGVYGIGYAIAATDPVRHWPVVLVGLIGKVLGPIGFMISYWKGNLDWPFFWQILSNDIIWWIPFVSVLYFVFRESNAPQNNNDLVELNAAQKLQSQMGLTINEISLRSPVMLVFLRHAGCTFCRQTLSDLNQLRDSILNLGVEVAIVHMGSPMEGTMMLSKYDLDFFHRFSDPSCLLYRKFGFQRGNFLQVLSPRVLMRGLRAAIFGGHGIGSLQGDSFQLPGVVVLFQELEILAFPAKNAAERFNFLEIAKRASAVAANLSQRSGSTEQLQTSSSS